ncbi:MAG: hypothetical protein KDE09_17580 [Anaerolineales bacterium]|nr:hypothetical protein [Anaerolineales bacterium]MCB0012968.1 hypothetical protein [Anaerolineales bacterium]MCB0019608.1 hypothetical protein [Anaerolineales bacterium]MCB0026366.1 hypothetical protein [Anaerolineales bacterium]MCB8958862.1 hypothetical protein [Ardenticatenales bacterium]
MSKKVRRSKNNGPEPAQAVKSNSEIAAQVQSNRRRDRRQVAINTGLSRKINSVDELREEYAYVIKDLRLIFAIAALMFLILFVLNFVLL